MSVQPIKEALRRLDADGCLDVGPPPRSARRWLDQLDLPEPLRELLASCWPRKHHHTLPAECHSIWPIRKIMKDDDASDLLADRLLLIGNTTIFDFVAVAFDREGIGEVGLVSHDLLWGRSRPPRACFKSICDSLGTYVRCLEDGVNLPWIYYDIPNEPRRGPYRLDVPDWFPPE